MVLIAFLVVALDQFTKHLVLAYLPGAQEYSVINGFLRLVHWTNTGAAWSMFPGKNSVLAVVAVAALVILFLSRHHFDSRTVPGRVSFGLIFGGIIGNLIDRLTIGHVIDFLYFYVRQRSGTEIGFPAFNVADSAICVGVCLIFITTWRHERRPRLEEPAPQPSE